MTTILDGKKVSKETKDKISNLIESSDEEPSLATIIVGDNSASQTYVKLKRKDCNEVGIDFKLHDLPSDASQSELMDLIAELNQDEDVDGIIVQLPVPSHLNEREISKEIEPSKDVDGINPHNVGKLWTGDYDFESDLLSCTPKGIMRLLDYYDLDLEGERAVIVNRSDLVGKPLSKLMLDRNATVTICHSRTRDMQSMTRQADVLVTAVGTRPAFAITEEMVSEGAIVVDVGMNYLEDELYGDVVFDEVKEKSSYITPVPGGVGPMTRVSLLENVLIAAGIWQED